MVKNFEDMCNRLDTIPACTDRRTDRQTDILPRHSPRYTHASCDKNRETHAIKCFILRNQSRGFLHDKNRVVCMYATYTDNDCDRTSYIALMTRAAFTGVVSWQVSETNIA